MDIEDLGYLSVGSQMRRIYEKLQIQADNVYEKVGLRFKSSWFPIYYTLSTSRRALTVMEITERISYTRTTVKNVLRELERNRYVEIFSNPLDSRSKLIQLTTEGVELSEKVHPVWKEFQAELERIFQGEDKLFLKKLDEVNHSLQGRSFENAVLKRHFKYSVRKAKAEEYSELGALMVRVYSRLKGFPSPDEQPKYYELLRDVGRLAQNKDVDLLVAVSEQGKIGGGVVFFGDMRSYGSGGTATLEKKACGFRLLAVDEEARGMGLGRLLTEYCIDKAKRKGARNMVIHTTKSMQLAWKMYERLGFRRAEDLDFMLGNLPVFGFRLLLNKE